MRQNRGLLAAILGGALMLLAGCGPTYPKCENDEHCKEHNQFCVNQLCQQCRDNSHCDGAGMMCAAGKCTRKPGYCDPNVACPGDQKCRDNECGDECLDNTDCSNKPGTYCSNGGCIDKPECGENADTPACPEGKECKDGRCEQKVARCNGAAVLFPFNQAKILNAERNKLDAIADCMKDPYASQLSVEGHCDERGSEEYNLTLGEQRANAVKQYLSRKGVSANKLSARSWGEERPASSGSNESAWRKNRRTEFVPN